MQALRGEVHDPAVVDSKATGGPFDRGVDVWPLCRRGCLYQPLLDPERTPAVVPEVAQVMTPGVFFVKNVWEKIGMLHACTGSSRMTLMVYHSSL